MRNIIVLFIFLVSCTQEIEYISDRHACATEGSSGSSETSSSEASSSSEESSGSSSEETGSSSGGSETGLPSPQGTCPTIANGVVEFCIPNMPCRDALVVNANDADGTGPLALHWHGTYETPDGVLSWDYAAQQIETMVQAENGLMILPYADPDAVSRSNNPFPWWVVCGDVSPSGCNIEDDFELADEIVACALEQELVDPQRLTTSGMSAGGIMTSHLLDRTSYFAGAVSWSGGVRIEDRPTTPPNTTAVMVLHGGPTDVYCGQGVTSCYDFVEASEALAADLVSVGNFAFLCDHQSGHAASMGPQGAQFLGLAHTDGHPWASYTLGSSGNWMLDNFCYNSGDPSPWE